MKPSQEPVPVGRKNLIKTSFSPLWVGVVRSIRKTTVLIVSFTTQVPDLYLFYAIIISFFLLLPEETELFIRNTAKSSAY